MGLKASMHNFAFLLACYAAHTSHLVREKRGILVWHDIMLVQVSIFLRQLRRLFTECEGCFYWND